VTHREHPLDPEIVAHRREQVVTRRLARLFLFVNLGFLGWVAVTIFIIKRNDPFYILPSVFGTLTGLLRYLTHRVDAVPKVLLDLRDAEPAVADRAWQVIEAHREELLAKTVIPATIREPTLLELDRAGLTERVARVGTVNWRKGLKLAFWIWLPLAITMFLATLLFAPEPLTPWR
jgi:hypothetical protein